jgi:DNA-binding transcriptional MerR regulator
MEGAGLSSAVVQRRTGATRKALLLYEAHALITKPSRTRAGWRRYASRTVEEVRFIRAAVAVGLRLDDLRPALEQWRAGNSACPALTPLLQKRAAQVERELHALLRQQRQLKAMIQQWDSDCACGQSVCPQLFGEPPAA